MVIVGIYLILDTERWPNIAVRNTYINRGFCREFEHDSQQILHD